MPKQPRTTHPAEQIISRFLIESDELLPATQGGRITDAERRRLEVNISKLIKKLGDYLEEIHPVREPTFVFDAGNPDIIGRFVGLALVAQPKKPLIPLDRFYGSGVYALYYDGDFPSYAPIRETETPIYVGKADPDFEIARTPKEQGEKLSGRLKDHIRSIKKATSTIRVEDFYFRCLVVQSGWQQAAENYLISLFQPIWNNETNICYGFGKHGDDPRTRKNLRSPWDTLHPGRDWAHRDPSMADATPVSKLKDQIAEHFKSITIYHNLDNIFRNFVEGLRQL